VKGLAKRTITMTYNTRDLNVAVESGYLEADEIGQLVHDGGTKSVVLETTTLGFVETYLCCRAMRDACAGGVSLTYLSQGAISSAQIRRCSSPRF